MLENVDLTNIVVQHEILADGMGMVSAKKHET